MTKSTRNPYQASRGFVSDPFVPLYNNLPGEPFTFDETVEELLDYARTLEDMIRGDFNLGNVINEIKGNFLSFVRTGLLAYKVKLWKLYQNGYRSFKIFCEEALGVTHWQINRNIDAARVVMELAQNGFQVLPQCEAQARLLTKFHGADLCANWQIVVENLSPSKITSSKIMEVLGMETKAGSLRLSKELIELIRKRALELGVSIEEFLEMMLGIGEETSEVDEEQVAAWKEDLVRMAQEYDIAQEKEISQETALKEEKSVPIGTGFSSSTTRTQDVSTSSSEESQKNKKSVPIGTVSTAPPEAYPTQTIPTGVQVTQDSVEEAHKASLAPTKEEDMGTSGTSSLSPIASSQGPSSPMTPKKVSAQKSFLDLFSGKTSPKAKKKRQKRGFGSSTKDDS